MEKQVLNMGQASKYMGVSRQTLRKYVDSGIIPCKRISERKTFFLKSALDEWLTKN